MPIIEAVIIKLKKIFFFFFWFCVTVDVNYSNTKSKKKPCKSNFEAPFCFSSGPPSSLFMFFLIYLFLATIR